jgi:hypothetical protein
VRPVTESVHRGHGYPTAGTLLLDLVLGTSLSGDPSGSARQRTFEYPTVGRARAAALEAVAAATASGIEMSPLDSFGTLAPNEQSSGHIGPVAGRSPGPGHQHLTVTVNLVLTGPNARALPSVWLLLDGGY